MKKKEVKAIVAGVVFGIVGGIAFAEFLNTKTGKRLLKFMIRKLY